MTAAATYLVSNPGTMFLLMEEKVQVLAREERPVEEEGGSCGCVGQMLNGEVPG